jgi:hypothetical protein
MSLLVNQSQVNASSAFFAPASGGGGGGGGPNLSVSTIVVNPAPASNAITMPNGGSGVTPVITGFTNNSATATSTTTLGVQFVTGYTGPQGLSGVWAVENGDNLANAYYGDFCAGRFIVAGNNSGAVQALPIISAGVNGDMTISAISSLNIATPLLTQNGVPISGGSVGPNLGLSTLTFGGGSNPGMFMENKTILLNPAASVSTVGSAGLAWNNTTSNIQLIAPSTTSVYIATEKITGNLQVKDDGVYCSPFVSTPNLTVSSINGAAYPPPAGGITRTTLNTLSGVSVLGDGSLTVITGDITPTAGHLYQIVGDIYSITSSNASSNAQMLFSLGNNDRVSGSPFPAVGYSAASGSVFGNQPYVNLMFKATSGGPGRIYAQLLDAGGTAVSSFTNAAATLNVLDYGPVA